MENKNSKKKEIHAGILDEIKIRAKYTRQAMKACRTFFYLLSRTSGDTTIAGRTPSVSSHEWASK